MNLVLETVSGRLIDPSSTDPDQIVIEDIAWSLSRIARFAGHTITTVPYVVGQHCCFVASMIIEQHPGATEELVLFGQLHDAAEYLIGDIPSPIKKVPAFAKVIEPMEERLLNTIYTKFVGRTPTAEEWTTVKYYDKKAQFIEAAHYMSSRGKTWPGRERYNLDLVELQQFPQPISSVEAYKAFLQMFNENRLT